MKTSTALAHRNELQLLLEHARLYSCIFFAMILSLPARSQATVRPDLLVGMNDGTITAYQNAASCPTSSFVANGAWDVGDIGNLARPGFGDLDADGDYDLLIGATSGGGNALGYENTGSGAGPSWAAKAAWNLPSAAGSWLTPAIKDLDNDGDLDLMIGHSDGIVYGYRNTGTKTSPIWTAQPSWNTTDIGDQASPCLVDLDADGDFDLLIGSSSSVVYAYRNTGTATSPVWTAQASWDSPSISPDANTGPAAFDRDCDGDYDLLIGGSGGTLYAYSNTGTKTSPAWTYTAGDNMVMASANCKPIALDLNDNEIKAPVATTKTIEAGAFIVNMGVTPQTIANGMKPYGMVYDLTRNYYVPIIWAIADAKAMGAKDFTYSGVDYKGGTFIIEKDYRSAAVDARINYWKTQGVVGVTTTSAVNVPVREVITSFPQSRVDIDNALLVADYYTNAGIPSSAYSTGLPSSLTSCEDAFWLPHADPTWADHGAFLRNWVINNKGYVWAGCHSISIFENLRNPSNITEKTNFLTTNGLKCYAAGNCGAWVTETHAGGATTPYTDATALGSELVLQYMPSPGPASEGGSEKWYIPLTGSEWRSSSVLGVTTADGSGNAKGSVLVYGRAYGNPNFGKVMYQAGHQIDNGTVAQHVAAQRAFFNFLLVAGIDKKLVLTASVPSTVNSNQTVPVSATASLGTGPYSFYWTTNTGGTFANPNVASTDFTMGNQAARGTVTVRVTDACGRVNFISVPINPQGNPLPVEMISFEAVVDEGSVALKWITVEFGVERFEIERSIGDENWDLVATVTAKGDQTQATAYTVTDEAPIPGTSFYRLREVDFDGNWSIAGLDKVTVSAGTPTVGVNPNPSDGNVHLDLYGPQATHFVVMITNSMGSVIYEGTATCGANTAYRHDVPVALPSGIYLLSWNDGVSHGATRFVVRQ